VTRRQLRFAARGILKAGLAAVDPERLVRSHLCRDPDGTIRVAGKKLQPFNRLFLVSVGKAAWPMARSAHKVLGNRITSSTVISTQTGRGVPGARAFVAGHPLPNTEGLRAGRHVIGVLRKASRGDLVLLLLSGGASALMPSPLPGVSLREKQKITRILLERGASIREMNAVRKRLSLLKGGGFARLADPARVAALVLSDVPGNDIRTIGSGLTAADPRAAVIARHALRRYFKSGEVPTAVRKALARPSRAVPLRGARNLIIGSGRTFADAAAAEATRRGFRTRVLVDVLRGEARTRGAQLLRQFERWRKEQPSCLIATGETVVQVKGKGRGGRNQELALGALHALAKMKQPTVLAAFATDGRDGKSHAAGGIVDDDTERRSIAARVPVLAELDGNNSTRVLGALGGLLVTGPTGTNVADITVVLG
jgi:glycerate 2-kinase